MGNDDKNPSQGPVQPPQLAFSSTDDLFVSGVIDTDESSSEAVGNLVEADSPWAELAEPINNHLLRDFWFGKNGNYQRLGDRDQADKNFLLAIIETEPFDLQTMVQFTNNWEYRQIDAFAKRLERKYAKQFDVSLITTPITAILDKFDQASEVFDQKDGWGDKLKPFLRKWLRLKKGETPGILIKVFSHLNSFWKDSQKITDAHDLENKAKAVNLSLLKILEKLEEEPAPKKKVLEKVSKPAPGPANLIDEDVEEFEFDEGEAEEAEEADESAVEPASLEQSEKAAEKKAEEVPFNKDNFELIISALHDDQVSDHFQKQLFVVHLSDLFPLFADYKTGDALPDLANHWNVLWEMFALSVSENLNNLWTQYKDQPWLKVFSNYLISPVPLRKEPEMLRQYWDLYSSLLRLAKA
jgi:hypothetical protein